MYSEYCKRVTEVLSRISEHQLDVFVEKFLGVRRVWVLGNGGSMATAMHFAEDLASAGVCAQALSDISYLTMAANDFGYDQAFGWWIGRYAEVDDLVIGISTSGESRNVVVALSIAKARGMVTVGLIGRSVSTMEGYCKEAIVLGIERGLREVKVAEDVHSLLCHVLSEKVREQVGLRGAGVEQSRSS